MPPVPGANPILKEKKRRKQNGNGGNTTPAASAADMPTEAEVATTVTVLPKEEGVAVTNKDGIKEEEGEQESATNKAIVCPLEATYGSAYTPVSMVGIDDLLLAPIGSNKGLQKWKTPLADQLTAPRIGTSKPVISQRGRGAHRKATAATKTSSSSSGRPNVPTTSTCDNDGDDAAEGNNPELMFVPDPTRGLTNSSNACFLNATMQAISHLPALSQILVACALQHQLTTTTTATSTPPTKGGSKAQKGPPRSSLTTSKTMSVAPTCVSLGEWIQRYYQLPSVGGTFGGLGGALTSPALPAVTGSSRSTMTGQSQEDASEYLQLLLETIQQELRAYEDHLLHSAATTSSSSAAASKANNPLVVYMQQQQGNNNGDGKDAGSAAGEGKGWVTVGKSKGDMFTIKTVRPKSIPSSFTMDTYVFGGMLHHQLKGGTTTRNKGVTSVRAQPFFAIPVEVGGAAKQTIEEALKFTCARETVENDERGTTMTKQEKVGVLPQTLIVQIKRWAVTAEGDVVKLDNTITFGPTLVLPNDVTSHAGMPGVDRTYALSSVVCHRGTGSTKGHYVTYLNNCSQSAISSSEEAGRGYPLNLCNDFKVTLSTLSSVWEDSPYFIFYRKVGPTTAAAIPSKKKGNKKN